MPNWAAYPAHCTMCSIRHTPLALPFLSTRRSQVGSFSDSTRLRPSSTTSPVLESTITAPKQPPAGRRQEAGADKLAGRTTTGGRGHCLTCAADAAAPQSFACLPVRMAQNHCIMCTSAAWAAGAAAQLGGVPAAPPQKKRGAGGGTAAGREASRRRHGRLQPLLLPRDLIGIIQPIGCGNFLSCVQCFVSRESHHLCFQSRPMWVLCVRRASSTGRPPKYFSFLKLSSVRMAQSQKSSFSARVITQMILKLFVNRWESS